MAPRDIGLFLRSARSDAQLARILADGATRSRAFDQLYDDAPEHDPWGSASQHYLYQRSKYDALVSLLPSTRLFERSLDIGCGTGLLTQRLRGNSSNVVGIDLSFTAISRARERFSGQADLHFLQADLLNLAPSFEKSFDLVVVADVLYYLPPAALTDSALTTLASRLAALLRPGGILLLANHYFSGLDRDSRVSRRIHDSFRASQAIDVTLERRRPFWLAGLFARREPRQIPDPAVTAAAPAWTQDSPHPPARHHPELENSASVLRHDEQDALPALERR